MLRRWVGGRQREAKGGHRRIWTIAEMGEEGCQYRGERAEKGGNHPGLTSPLTEHTCHHPN